ncbi:hypothetical protein ACOIXW_004639 [Vibrio parahaemolyticus]|nr:hypothetical protein [Vibrio parahaemolyticus]HCG9740475.1 hypothetical protein [Vibrio parahaemolyticus]
MEFSEIVNQILLPFGGISVVLVSLSTFLGGIISKRIINNELAQHRMDLEKLKLQHEVKLNAIKNENDLRLESLRQEYSQKMEVLKAENSNKLEGVRNEIKKELMKYEVFSSMSKEKFQDLFQKRIDVYTNFLALKNEIDKSASEDIERHFFMDDDPRPFAEVVAKINDATRDNLMLISNELAVLSSELFDASSVIFTEAKARSTYIEYGANLNSNELMDASLEAEREELDKLYQTCEPLYKSWLLQLEKDVSMIRSTLDIAYDYFGTKH